MGTTLAKAGYVGASVEYKRSGHDRWPTTLKDCKNAVRFLRANAAHYQVDAEYIGVLGGSAGGHLALMVAYTPGLKELSPELPYPGVRDDVKAVVDLYGITYLLTRQSTEPDGTPNGHLREAGLFPDERGKNVAKWRLASPVNHISKSSPPTLILHGMADTTVDRDQSTRLAKATLDHFKTDPVHARPAGAEPLADFHARVAAALDDLLERHAGEHVLLVGHAGVMRMALAWALQIPLRHAYRIEVATASLTRLRFDAGRASLIFHGSPRIER